MSIRQSSAYGKFKPFTSQTRPASVRVNLLTPIKADKYEGVLWLNIEHPICPLCRETFKKYFPVKL